MFGNFNLRGIKSIARVTVAEYNASDYRSNVISFIKKLFYRVYFCIVCHFRMTKAYGLSSHTSRICVWEISQTGWPKSQRLAESNCEFCRNINTCKPERYYLIAHSVGVRRESFSLKYISVEMQTTATMSGFLAGDFYVRFSSCPTVVCDKASIKSAFFCTISIYLYCSPRSTSNILCPPHTSLVFLICIVHSFLFSLKQIPDEVKFSIFLAVCIFIFALIFVSVAKYVFTLHTSKIYAYRNIELLFFKHT